MEERLEHLVVVLVTGSSVQAALGAKFCFLGMPHLAVSLWGSALFPAHVPSRSGLHPGAAQAGRGSGQRCSARGTAQQNLGTHLGFCSSLC